MVGICLYSRQMMSLVPNIVLHAKQLVIYGLNAARDDYPHAESSMKHYFSAAIEEIHYAERVIWFDYLHKVCQSKSHE